MRSLLLILFVSLLLFSCSDKEESTFEDVKTKICQSLKNDNSPENIQRVGKLYKSDFTDLFELKEDEEAEYLTKLRSCFADMGFSKEIKPLNENPIEGSLSKYLKLTNTDVKVVLKNANAPAFSIDFVFEGIEKRDDAKDFEINGSIIIYDSDKQVLMKYNLYPVPDFYNTISAGKGDFKFTAYLDAIWYPYSKKPFDEAVKYMLLMSNAEYYSITLGIKGEKEEKKNKDDDKEYHEMLDNLEILNAVS